MPFYEVGSIKYFNFTSLENQGLYHAIFTRHGGFSPTPWRSLNFGASVGDDALRVVQNRETALNSVNIKHDSVYDLYQVQSAKVVVTDKPLPPNTPHIKADAMITNKPNITLMMRFADCVPILLFDPVFRVVGISHAGWIGTVDQIVKKTILLMNEKYGTDPKDIIATIGPSIGPDHYSVGKDVVDRVHASFGDKVDQLVIQRDGKTFFDLWNANKVLLTDVGVKNIEVSQICTFCNLDDWYSHRGEHGSTGRFGVILGLNQ